MDNIEKQTKEIIKKYNLDKKIFTNKKAPSNLHFFFVVGEMPFDPVKSFFGRSHTLTCFYIKNGTAYWWWNDEDLDNLRNFFINKFLKNPKIILNFKEEYYKRAKIFNKKSNKISRYNLTQLSYKELHKLYEEWYEAYKNFHGLANSIHDALTMHPEKWIEPELKKYIKNKADYNEIYLALISLTKETFETEEYKERLNLAKSINNKDFEKKLITHEKKWHWLRNNYATCFYLDKEYFRKEIKKIKIKNIDEEIKKINDGIKLVRRNKKLLIKRLGLSRKAKLFINLAEELGFMQDDRKRYVMPATYYQNIFFEEFGRRLNLTNENMNYTYIHELKNLKNKKVNQDFFFQRKKCSLVMNSLKGYEVFSGNLALNICKKVFESNIEFQGELKGQSASMGYVIGYVKKIINTKDILRVKKGDIVVASMTKPDALPAMKKAAAIITDEGGITCHAAIVSRELGKPCVIGTKIATQVLKDGDRVEVDADNGIVKIIK